MKLRPPSPPPLPLPQVLMFSDFVDGVELSTLIGRWDSALYLAPPPPERSVRRAKV